MTLCLRQLHRYLPLLLDHSVKAAYSVQSFALFPTTCRKYRSFRVSISYLLPAILYTLSVCDHRILNNFYIHIFFFAKWKIPPSRAYIATGHVTALTGLIVMCSDDSFVFAVFSLLLFLNINFVIFVYIKLSRTTYKMCFSSSREIVLVACNFVTQFAWLRETVAAVVMKLTE